MANVCLPLGPRTHYLSPEVRALQPDHLEANARRAIASPGIPNCCTSPITSCCLALKAARSQGPPPVGSHRATPLRAYRRTPASVRTPMGVQQVLERAIVYRMLLDSLPRHANYGIADGLVIVARDVAHHHEAQRLLRVDAHHVPEPGPAAEVLDESGTPLRGLARAEPAQPKVSLTPSRRDPLHHRYRLWRQQPRTVGLTAVQMELDKSDGFADAPDQSAVGCAVDVEGVERDVPPVPRTHYASRQGGPEEWGERSPAGLVGDGSLLPRKLWVGKAGVVHSQGEEDLLAHVFLVPHARDL